MAPRIGVTSAARQQSEAYYQALLASGAVVVALRAGSPADPDVIGNVVSALSGLDGLVLSGGLDVDPQIYGESERHPTVRVEEDRDLLELPLCRAALASGLPVLGICRGAQLLNVAAGGRLWQDLPGLRPATALHMESIEVRDRRRRLHVITAVAGTLTADLIGMDPLAVNSIHHQAVRDVGSGLRIGALAPDGVIESIEGTRGSFAVGVQWHPEELSNEDARHRAIFDGLCRAAVRYQQSRDAG